MQLELIEVTIDHKRSQLIYWNCTLTTSPNIELVIVTPEGYDISRYVVIVTIMQLELIEATIDHKSILANLLELYIYDFTEFCDFDIGDDGHYGYKYLPLYWIEPTRFPYLIYVDKKIAGFVLVRKQSAIADGEMVWDISEFFIMKKYRKRGLGTAAAVEMWKNCLASGKLEY